MGPRALTALQSGMSRRPQGDVTAQILPVTAVAIAAAAWCARGALASIPTSALTDIMNGRYSGHRNYVAQAIIGCLVGEIGGWAWRVPPG